MFMTNLLEGGCSREAVLVLQDACTPEVLIYIYIVNCMFILYSYAIRYFCLKELLPMHLQLSHLPQLPRTPPAHGLGSSTNWTSSPAVPVSGWEPFLEMGMRSLTWGFLLLTTQPEIFCHQTGKIEYEIHWWIGSWEPYTNRVPYMHNRYRYVSKIIC